MSDAPYHEPVKVLTEQTSKAIKLRVLISWAAVVVGFIGTISAPSPKVWVPCALLFWAALLFLFVMKLRRWWMHG